MFQEGLGKVLEESGWLQGAIIRHSDAKEILQSSICIDVDLESIDSRKFVLLVATQSCNLVNDVVQTVQLCIAELIESPNPAFEYNKNPRKLDTFYTILGEDEDSEDISKQYIRIDILEKVFAPKAILTSIDFERSSKFAELEKRSFVDWLGAHYTKPALPTDFNDALSAIPSKKRRKVEKDLSKDFLGFYVKIFPNRELQEGEQYEIQLLGLMMDESDENSAKQSMLKYKGLIENSGIKVAATAVRRKSQVSIAMFDDFSRIYLDELSYREGDNYPPDLKF